MSGHHLTNPLHPPGGDQRPGGSQSSLEVVPESETGPRRGSGCLAASSPWLPAALCGVLLVAVVALYYPVYRFPFLALNDGEYVAQNLRIQQLNWNFVSWSLTTFHAANWHPLTWLSHALDYQLFGLDAGGHHAMNLLLHVLNALLLFWVLWRATGYAGCSFMVAALFALHPINVESVAWVAERKNLLSMMFLLLALGAYRWYASGPRLGRYSMVALLYVLGLMAKPQVITLPFLLLLWDYWPLERMNFASDNSGAPADGSATIPQRSFSWLLLEKLPLLALSAASAIVTVCAQRAGGAMGGALRSYPLRVRIENAVISYARYLDKAIWPSKLGFFYPHAYGFRLRQIALASLLLLLVSAFTVAFRQRRYLLVGWLWFLGALVPMIGLLQVGGQAMADRYAYLPFVGLFIAVCWGAADWAEQWRVPQGCVAGASVLVLALLGFATHRQVSYWSSDLALWSHTAVVTTPNAAAENVVAETLQREGREEDAMVHFRTASAMDPLLPYPHYHIGVYDEDQGRPREAIAEFQQVIALTARDKGVLAELRADAFQRLSSAYEAIGDAANADRCVKLSLQEKRKEWSFDAGTHP